MGDDPKVRQTELAEQLWFRLSLLKLLSRPQQPAVELRQIEEWTALVPARTDTSRDR